MSRVLIVGIGGYFGAITRYLIGGWIANYGGTSFPLSTFVINITGSFFLGLVMALVTERFVSPTVQPLIAIGFIGAFTTFSTFTFETIRLVENGSFGLALTNAVGSVVVGLIAVYVGLMAGRAI